MTKSIIIIGAGISGLSAGCYAAMNSYEVRIVTREGEPVWEGTVARPPAVLPEEVRERLEAGESYFWQVVAQSEEGGRWESAPTLFTIWR